MRYDSSNRRLTVTPYEGMITWCCRLESFLTVERGVASGETPKEEQTEEASTLRMYTNVADVQRVESLPILTRNGYLETGGRTVAASEEEICRLTEESKNQKDYQENCEEEILRLTEGKKYQTEEEIEETDRLIQTARQKVEASEENCKQIEKSITECREKIAKGK